MAKEPKVRWTDEEKAEIVQRAANILYKNHGISTLEALRRSQDSFLPLERRRVINTLLAVPWFKPALDKQMEEHKKQIILSHQQEKIIEEVVILPVSLPEVPTDDLIAELLRRVLINGGAGIIARLTSTLSETLRTELPHAISKLKEKPLEAKSSRKRVFIVGLLPDQVQVITKEFGDVFDLSFWKDENIHLLKSKAINQDKILVMKKFISHSFQDALRSVRVQYTIVPGAVSELKAVLEKYYFEVNP